MFGGQLLAFFIFCFVCWLIWRAIGNKMIDWLNELFLGPEDLDIIRAELKLKIESLEQHQDYLKSVREEIEVTGELTKTQKELKEDRKKLNKLNEKLGPLKPNNENKENS